MEKNWTIIQLLNETHKYFEKKGIESARLDAEILLAFALNKDRINLYIDFQSPVNDNELTIFRDMVKRRAKREPVAYITGYKEFWSMNLKVTRDVLIPRPETELIVEHTQKIIIENYMKGQKIFAADIGTGSGAISIALAKECRNVLVCSVDISLNALNVAKENIVLNGFEGKDLPVCADGFTAFKETEIFDFILSNPPYVVKDDITGLQPEISEYEPYIALDGGDDGLDFYRNNILCFCSFLKPGGFVLLEIGEDQGAFVSGLFIDSNEFEQVYVIKDYSGHDRVIRARKKK
jgi:release factor glutamine methyltransferase